MENKITYLDITLIEPNPRNPRKSFDDTALGELSDSIKTTKGVLQPVTVRPVQNSQSGVQYQLVCGERRWRATAMAGFSEIPAIIRELTDEEAMDVAITENLQRKDVSPLEEADSFKYYMAERGLAIADLCLRFGKSDPYIRGRLKLLDIIVEFRTLLSDGVISISQAMEIIKFETDVQTLMYNEHFKNSWNSWCDLKASKLYQMAMKCYTKELSRYAFDKKDCERCLNCTKNSSLFAFEEEASCLNGVCLREKDLDHRVALALSLRSKHPEADFYARDKDGKVKGGLEAQGNEVIVTRTWINRVGAVISKDLKTKLAAGAVVLAIDVQDTPYLGYIDKEQASGGDKVRSLREKDKRNMELLEENTVSDVRDAISSMDVKTLSEGTLTDYESQLTLFILLKRLKTDQQKNLGEVEYSMSDEEAWRVVLNATPEQTAYIYRCSILNQIGDHIRKDFKTDLFFEWVNARDKQIVPMATQKHEVIYQKRHEKLEAHIAEILSAKEV